MGGIALRRFAVGVAHFRVLIHHTRTGHFCFRILVVVALGERNKFSRIGVRRRKNGDIVPFRGRYLSAFWAGDARI